jgi:hypothetical protein
MKVENENAICAVKNDDLIALRFSRRIPRRGGKPENVFLEIVHGCVPVFQKLVTKEFIRSERKLSSTVLKIKIECSFASKLSKEYRFF